VIDTSLTDNKFYTYNQLGLFLFYNKNLDYPIDLSNYFILNNEQILKLPSINTGLLEQDWKKNKYNSKKKVFTEFINKNSISYILSRNKEANNLIKELSTSNKRITNKYNNGNLFLWEIRKKEVEL
jgi:hypothetical protein